MSTYKASAQDQKRAEDIRRQYISREDNTMEQLQKLDNKVKAPGKAVASILGVIWGPGHGCRHVHGDGMGEYAAGAS